MLRKLQQHQQQKQQQAARAAQQDTSRRRMEEERAKQLEEEAERRRVEEEERERARKKMEEEQEEALRKRAAEEACMRKRMAVAEEEMRRKARDDAAQRQEEERRWKQPKRQTLFHLVQPVRTCLQAESPAARVIRRADRALRKRRLRAEEDDGDDDRNEGRGSDEDDREDGVHPAMRVLQMLAEGDEARETEAEEAELLGSIQRELARIGGLAGPPARRMTFADAAALLADPINPVLADPAWMPTESYLEHALQSAYEDGARGSRALRAQPPVFVRCDLEVVSRAETPPTPASSSSSDEVVDAGRTAAAENASHSAPAHIHSLKESLARWNALAAEMEALERTRGSVPYAEYQHRKRQLQAKQYAEQMRRQTPQKQPQVRLNQQRPFVYRVRIPEHAPWCSTGVSHWSVDYFRSFHRPRGAFRAGDRFSVSLSPHSTSAGEDPLVLCEYMEQFPPLLQIPGMSSRLVTFGRRPHAQADVQAEEALQQEHAPGSTGLLRRSLLVADSLRGKQRSQDDAAPSSHVVYLDSQTCPPVLGDVPVHKMMTVLSNSLFHAPVVQHSKAKGTEYLCMWDASRGQYVMRHIDSAYAVGQLEPRVAVPEPPGARDVDVAAMYKSCGGDNPWTVLMLDCLARAEPRSSIPAPVTAELVCAHESMLAGLARLNDRGIDMPLRQHPSQSLRPGESLAHASAYWAFMHAYLEEQKDPSKKDLHYVLIERKQRTIRHQINALHYVQRQWMITPWNLVHQFIENHTKGGGKALLDMGRAYADPLGDRRGFSFVPAKPRRRGSNRNRDPVAQWVASSLVLRVLRDLQARPEYAVLFRPIPGHVDLLAMERDARDDAFANSDDFQTQMLKTLDGIIKHAIANNLVDVRAAAEKLSPYDKDKKARATSQGDLVEAIHAHTDLRKLPTRVLLEYLRRLGYAGDPTPLKRWRKVDEVKTLATKWTRDFYQRHVQPNPGLDRFREMDDPLFHVRFFARFKDETGETRIKEYQQLVQQQFVRQLEFLQRGAADGPAAPRRGGGDGGAWDPDDADMRPYVRAMAAIAPAWVRGLDNVHVFDETDVAAAERKRLRLPPAHARADDSDDEGQREDDRAWMARTVTLQWNESQPHFRVTYTPLPRRADWMERHLQEPPRYVDRRGERSAESAWVGAMAAPVAKERALLK